MTFSRLSSLRWESAGQVTVPRSSLCSFKNQCFQPYFPIRPRYRSAPESDAAVAVWITNPRMEGQARSWRTATTERSRTEQNHLVEKQLNCSQALQESGCLRGNARPLSIAASLMMGFFTSTQSVSYGSEDNGTQQRHKELGWVSACTCVNPHSVCSRIHWTVILQQPVVISPVCT